MSLFSRLFGGGKAAEDPPAVDAEHYKDFRIFAAPIRESSGYRIAARIEKEIDGETRVHELIRADTVQGPDDAAAISIQKARQVIDEQGDALFRDSD